MRTPAAVLASCIVFLGLACAPAEQAPPPAEPEMTQAEAQATFDALVEAWDAVQNADDVDALMALYAADPAAMPPEMPEVAGSAAVRELWAPFLEGSQDNDNVLKGFRVSGDLAVIWGTYTTAQAPEGGEPVTVAGKWMGILERQPDGSWKALRNIWNTDSPTGS
jgi:ketosteroid isomerase-like protein